MATVGSGYVARAAKVFPGGALNRLQVAPEDTIVVSHGRGARVWDMDGNEYVDLLMGGGPLILGHAHPEIVAAIQEQAARGSTFYSLTPQAIEVAEELVRVAPCAEEVIFTSTGSEAIHYALRLARAATGRRKIVKFEGGYHGHSEYVVFSYAPKEMVPFPQAVPESLGITDAVRHDVLIAPYNDLEQTEEVFKHHGDQVAAIVVEPVQRALMPRPGFLEGLRRIADTYGALLVFDEIVTQFRLAYGGAEEYFGVIPDLATFGKAMSGGYPMAAVVGRKAVMDFADPKHKRGKIHLSGTFNGHALAAAGALATLRLLRQPGTYERLHELGRKMRDEITYLFKTRGLPGQVLGPGPWFQVVLGDHEVYDYRTYKRCDHESMKAIQLQVRRQGILLNPESKCYLSLAHTSADLDVALSAWDKAFAAR